MKHITICTGIYMQEITDFYYNDVLEYVLDTGMAGDEFFVVLPEKYVAPHLLIDMMQDIVLEKNPIVSGQSKLFDTLKGMVFGAEQEKMAAELTFYLRMHERLNIEGYIHFRLGAYERTLSGILYSVVKRNLRIEES